MKTFATALLAGLCLLSCKNKDEKEIITEDTTEQQEMVTAKTCFLKVTTSSPEYNKDRIITDSIVFEMERKGDSVFGVLNWKPYEKDKKFSTFKGIIRGNKGTAIAESMGEGMEYKEELKFTLEGDKASIQYGEMVQGENNVWVYKEGAETAVQVLDEVPCK
ncbi:hypothetical protein GWA97_08200 [Flavobacterium sp. LaA7.5]|nr:hypothetical protein [Flavobacterium salilacus subsp. altitudinum]